MSLICQRKVWTLQTFFFITVWTHTCRSSSVHSAPMLCKCVFAFIWPWVLHRNTTPKPFYGKKKKQSINEELRNLCVWWLNPITFSSPHPMPYCQSQTKPKPATSSKFVILSLHLIINIVCTQTQFNYNKRPDLSAYSVICSVKLSPIYLQNGNMTPRLSAGRV